MHIAYIHRQIQIIMYAYMDMYIYMDVGQNPVPPVNLKVDGHPLYHMISRFWPIPIYPYMHIYICTIYIYV